MGTLISKSATCRKKSRSRSRLRAGGCRDVGACRLLAWELLLVDKAKPKVRPRGAVCAFPLDAEVRPARDNKRNTTGTAHRGNLIFLLFLQYNEGEE